MNKPTSVPYREQRQQLLRELEEARFHKELAQEYGLTDLATEAAIKEKDIELSIKILNTKK